MRFSAIVGVSLLASACGLFPKNHKESAPTSETADLNARADAYCEADDLKADAAGWVGEGCDLTLFNSLRSVGCPQSKVLIDAAENPAVPGEWNRDDRRACYVQGDPAASRTDARFSRDMLEGLILWVWAQGKPALPVLDRFIAYAEAHDWVICDAVDELTRQSKCAIGSGLEATVYELRFRLGGGDSTRRSGAQFWDPSASGFEANIQMMHLYARGLMFGAVSEPELGYLELIAGRNPANQLFAAMARKFKTSDMGPPTRAVLADSGHFPTATLPTSANRCTDYLWQRQGPDSADWRPCPTNPDGSPNNVTYTGIDLEFFRAVVDDGLPVTPAGANLVAVDADGNPRLHPYHWNVGGLLDDAKDLGVSGRP